MHRPLFFEQPPAFIAPSVLDFEKPSDHDAARERSSLQQSVVGEGFFVFGRSSSSEVKAPDLPKPAPPPMAMPPAMPMAAPVQLTGGSTLASDLTVIGQRVLLVSQSRLLIDG